MLIDQICNSCPIDGIRLHIPLEEVACFDWVFIDNKWREVLSFWVDDTNVVVTTRDGDFGSRIGERTFLAVRKTQIDGGSELEGWKNQCKWLEEQLEKAYGELERIPFSKSYAAFGKELEAEETFYHVFRTNILCKLIDLGLDKEAAETVAEKLIQFLINNANPNR